MSSINEIPIMKKNGVKVNQNMVVKYGVLCHHIQVLVPKNQLWEVLVNNKAELPHTLENVLKKRIHNAKYQNNDKEGVTANIQENTEEKAPPSLQNVNDMCYFNALMSSLFSLPSVQKIKDSDSENNFLKKFIELRDIYNTTSSDSVVLLKELQNIVNKEAAAAPKLPGNSCALEAYDVVLKYIGDNKNLFIIERESQNSNKEITNPETLTGVWVKMNAENDFDEKKSIRLQPPYKNIEDNFLPYYSNPEQDHRGIWLNVRTNSFPQILTIQLDRNELVNGGTGEGEQKNNTKKNMVNPNFEEIIKIKDQNFQYKLYAVTYHHGQKLSTGGHYTSRILKGNKWYNCNDTVVNHISDVKEPHEGQISMLFYEKENKEKENKKEGGGRRTDDNTQHKVRRKSRKSKKSRK